MEGVRRGDAGSVSNHRGVIIDGYVRVSQVAGRSDESCISPTVPRERIVSWAQVNGARIGAMF